MGSLSRERQIEIEIAVIETLQDVGVSQFPVSISLLAHALGIKLVPYSSLHDDERTLAFQVSGDAFHVRNCNYTDTRIIFDDTNKAHYYRSRFSGGHEIGHIVLEHDETTPDREREADYFSGYLLAPHPLILRLHEGFSISDVFGVSNECAFVATKQAALRRSEGVSWRPHEKWLIENATWKGGGLLGTI